jgi:hypothetical protein
MKLKRIPTSIIIFLLAGGVFCVLLHYFFPLHSWQSYLFIASVAALCFSCYFMGIDCQKEPKKLDTRAVYRFCANTPEGHILLSLLKGVSVVHQTNTFTHTGEELGTYIRLIRDTDEHIKIDAELKSGDFCMIIRKPGHLDGKPYLALYNENLRIIT